MRRKLLVAVVMVALLSSIAGGAHAQSSGHKLTDKLIRRAQSLTSSIRATNLQVKKTLESYNYIIEGKAEDPRAEYKKLVKELGRTRKARESVRAKAEAMQDAADGYFVDWEASQAGFHSEEIRAKSEARLAQTKQDYGRIFEAGSKAGNDFDAFIAKMDDQIRFLGHDLNPAAIAELADQAAELNEQADAFFGSINETLKTAVKYTRSLEPQ